jgi:hypothetical protein
MAAANGRFVTVVADRTNPVILTRRRGLSRSAASPERAVPRSGKPPGIRQIPA